MIVASFKNPYHWKKYKYR